MSRRTDHPGADCVSRTHLPLFDLKQAAGRIYAKALFPPESVWFQGRGGFVFAHAYNTIEQKPEWLAASKSAVEFLEKYCFWM